ncbi:methyl-accepting chemotaxis sensory transducer [Perkinsela sp. CCAP 1560/4]|nr:methyl-accepting chemotaxis sensory transducer [Perkinsela sp. CCAP 1560/4]|eukprot:KNH07046.1 methyl-accepting chemotaxis sensory transducer [Perkinsela sp. CCAP 1560/4]
MSFFGHNVEELFPETPVCQKEKKKWSLQSKLLSQTMPPVTEPMASEEPPVKEGKPYVPGGSYINFEDPEHERKGEYHFTLEREDMMEVILDDETCKRKPKRTEEDTTTISAEDIHKKDFLRTTWRFVKQLNELGLSEAHEVQGLLEEYQSEVSTGTEMPADDQSEASMNRILRIEERVNQLIEQLLIKCETDEMG